MTDFNRLWETNGGVYCGYGLDSPGLQGRPTLGQAWAYAEDRHIVTIGPNGSGKSKRLLVPNLIILTGWSILVIDPKGELAAMTAGARERAGGKIVILDPFHELPKTLQRMGAGPDEITRRTSQGFNPVAALNPASDDFADDAKGIAEALIKINEKDPHWSQAAQSLVAALIMFVRLVDPASSLADVRAELGRGLKEFGIHVKDNIIPVAKANDCPALEAKIARYSDISPEDKEAASILSSALTQTEWLDSTPIKRDLSAGGYDFGTMKDRPTTVYLILPARRLATHSTWLRLMINGVLQALMASTARARVPCLLMLDEAPQLGHLAVIENNLALMRGYGVKLWTLWQDLAQLKHLYSERWESFVENAGVLQSYAAQGFMTSDHLSKLTGTKEVARQSSNAGTSRQTTGGGVSYSEGGGVNIVDLPVLRPEEIRRMDAGYSIAFSHTLKNTKRLFCPYYKDLNHIAGACAADPSA